MEIDVQRTAGRGWGHLLQPFGEARNSREFLLEEGDTHLAVWQQAGGTEEL